MKKKILNILLQKDITTYLNYNFPLCSLLWNKNKNSWMFEHFTNFYLMRDDKRYIWIDYLEEVHFLNDVMDFSYKNVEIMRKQEDIIEYIKNYINQEYYIMIFVDKFFLRNSIFFHKEHVSQQSFIYGYDNELSEFFGVGYRSDGSFGEIKYNFNDILLGFQYCIKNYEDMDIWVDWYNCIQMKVKSPDKIYEYNANHFIVELKKFVYSSGTKKLLRPEILYERGENAIYGFEAQEELINAFNELKEDKFVLDYRSIHLLAEHKNLMYKKLIYTAEVIGSLNEFEDLLIQYRKLNEQYENIRLVFMKHVLIDNNMSNIYGCLKNKIIINELYKKLESSSNLEKEIYIEYINRSSNRY